MNVPQSGVIRYKFPCWDNVKPIILRPDSSIQQKVDFAKRVSEYISYASVGDVKIKEAKVLFNNDNELFNLLDVSSRAEVLYQCGFTLFEKKQYGQVINLLSRIFNEEEYSRSRLYSGLDNIDVAYREGVSYFHMKNFQEAINILEYFFNDEKFSSRLFELDNCPSMIQYAFGFSLINSGRRVDGVEVFREILDEGWYENDILPFDKYQFVEDYVNQYDKHMILRSGKLLRKTF